MRVHGHLHALIGLAVTLIAALSTPPVAGQSERQRETRTGGSIVPAPRYSSLPLRFEANHGQFDARASFLLRAPGYKVFLTSNGFVLAPTSGEPIRMTFEGAASRRARDWGRSVAGRFALPAWIRSRSLAN